MDAFSSSFSTKDIPADDLYSFHAQERRLFTRLVIDIAMHPVRAMGVIAFWLWLEEIGHPNIIPLLYGLQEIIIQDVVDEAEDCLRTLFRNPSDPSTALKNLPRVSTVLGSPVDLQYFHKFKDLAVKGIANVLNNVCPKIFVDLLEDIERKRSDRDDTASPPVKHHRKEPKKGGNNSTSKRDSTTPVLLKRTGLLGSPPSGQRQPVGVNHTVVSPADGVVMPITIYGEGTSSCMEQLFHPCNKVEQGSPNQYVFPIDNIPFLTNGYDTSTVTRDPTYEELAVHEAWLLSNIYQLKQAIQLTYMQLMMAQGYGPLLLGGASASASNLSNLPSNLSPLGGGRINQPISVDNHRQSNGGCGGDVSLSSIRLNPQARSYVPSDWDVPRDERTLFVTFSNGYPLPESDLRDFFSRHYGDVETVFIQNVEGYEEPLYARIIFNSLASILLVLDGIEKAKFIIKGRHVWARRYVPRKKQHKSHGFMEPHHLK